MMQKTKEIVTLALVVGISVMMGCYTRYFTMISANAEPLNQDVTVITSKDIEEFNLIEKIRTEYWKLVYEFNNNMLLGQIRDPKDDPKDDIKSLSDIVEDSMDIEIQVHEPLTELRYIITDNAEAICTLGCSLDIEFLAYGDPVALILPVEKDSEFCNILIGDVEYVIERRHLGYEEPPVRPASKGQYAGQFQLTAYAWTGYHCANGKYPTPKYTVAAHKEDFPMGTRLYIEGYGIYVVEDRGGFAKGVIDIYIGNKAQCIQFGRKHGVKVYVLEWGSKKKKK